MVAADAVNRLFRLGIDVSAHSDIIMQRMVASTLDESSCLMVISTTGEIAEINENALIAKQYGAKVIAVTRGGSPLAKLSDVHLQVHIEEDEGIYKATPSRYALLAVIDALALEVGMLRKTASNLRRLSSLNTAGSRLIVVSKAPVR